MAVNATVEEQAVVNASVIGTTSLTAGSSNTTYLKGDKGDKGDPGRAATVAAGNTTTLTPGSDATVTNSGTSSDAVFNFGIPAGFDGQDGQDGQDGFSPVVSSEAITGGHRITIVDAQGTTTVDVMDGVDGQDGQDGQDGTSAGFGTPTATIDSNVGTPGVTVSASGSDTAKVFSFAFTNLKGATGATGATGSTGPAGPGVAAGGTTSQILVKKSNTDYDTEWVNQSGGTVQTVNNVSPDGNGNITLTADDIDTDEVGVSVQDMVDNYVHVGASAPSDASVKLWLDTDEPGMSAVSSVNGAAGNVVLDYADVGAMAKWELLWELANPNFPNVGGFAAQTIQIDLSDYDAVLIYCLSYNNENPTVSAICLKGYVSRINRTNPTDSSAKMYSAHRDATVSATGVTFTNGMQSSASSNGSTNNDAIIPFRIYGLKW